MDQQLSMEITEQTPLVTVPCKIFGEAKPLTKEERKEIYEQLRKFEDHLKLPLPEDFFDDDVESDRGIMQLQMDAHRVGLLNAGKLEMSKEAEKELRDRLAHKIQLIRELRGIPELEVISEAKLPTIENS
jgi:hypothetical protein